jgi:hypothetical protein
MASRRNRYFKSLQGLNAQGFFSPAVEYTTATTFAGFVAGVGAGTISNGTMAVFNASTLAVQTAALTSGTKYFIAQALDGDVKKSVQFTAGTGNITVTKTAYSAPVKQRTIIGYNGTTGVIGTVIPAAGAEINLSLTVRDTSPASMPFPIQDGTTRITNSSATEYDAVASLVANLANVPDYQKNGEQGFVRVELISNGTKTAIAVVTATVQEGSPQIVYSAAHTLAVDDILQITLNGDSTVYKVVSVPSTTIAVLDRPFAGVSGTTAAGGTAKATVITEYGIMLTAYVEDTAFVVTKGDDLVNATVTNVTTWKQGSGAAWQIAEMEKETQVMAGYTTGNESFVDDYGKPTSFVSPESGVIYNTWFIKYLNSTPSMAYANENTHHVGYIVMAAPTSGSTPSNEFDTIFGT